MKVTIHPTLGARTSVPQHITATYRRVTYSKAKSQGRFSMISQLKPMPDTGCRGVAGMGVTEGSISEEPV